MYLLNNVTHEDHDLVVLDLPSAGLTARRYDDGSITLETTHPASTQAILSGPSANLLAELIAGNLEAPEASGWTEGDVVTFEPAATYPLQAARHLFTLQRGADGVWAIFVDGVPGRRRSAWSDESVDKLLDGRGVYDTDQSPYKNATVVIRQAGPR